jgi:hypothetical protein
VQVVHQDNLVIHLHVFELTECVRSLDGSNAEFPYQQGSQLQQSWVPQQGSSTQADLSDP